MLRGFRSVAAPLLLAWALAAPALAGKSADVRTGSFRDLSEGVAAYQRGDYATAVEKLQAAAGTALNSFRAHYYLGLALHAARRFPEAVAALEIALDLDPSQVQAHVALGDAWLRRGDADEALAAYVRALKLHSEYAPALDGIGRTYESKADEEKALEYFRRAITINKGYAEAYVHLADLYLRQDRRDDAVRLLLEAVTTRPDFAPALTRLGVAYGRMGLRNEAVASIRKAIALEPKVAEHRAALGRIQLDLDLPAGAASSFREALDLDPGSPEARAGMAELARRRGDYAGALAEIDSVLAASDLETPTRTRLAARREEIVAERDTAARIEPLVAAGAATREDRHALAEVYARRGMWSEAAALLQDAAAGPDRERLAYALLRAGRPRAAQPVYAELAAASSRPDLDLNEGVAFAGFGDDASAVLAYRRALGKDPLHADARLYLAASLLRLGRDDEAVREFKAFVDAHPEDEAVERVRRIVEQIAPGALPPAASAGALEKPAVPDAPREEETGR